MPKSSPKPRLEPRLKPWLKPLLAATALLSFSMAVWPLNLLQAYEAARLQDANILATRAATLASQERKEINLGKLMLRPMLF